MGVGVGHLHPLVPLSRGSGGAQEVRVKPESDKCEETNVGAREQLRHRGRAGGGGGGGGGSSCCRDAAASHIQLHQPPQEHQRRLIPSPHINNGSKNRNLRLKTSHWGFQKVPWARCTDALSVRLGFVRVLDLDEHVGQGVVN